MWYLSERGLSSEHCVPMTSVPSLGLKVLPIAVGVFNVVVVQAVLKS